MGDIVVQMTRQSRALAFVFKRKVFLRQADGPSDDPMFQRLLYLQAQDEIICGNLPLANASEVSKVTAMQIAVDNEEFPANEDELVEAELLEYLPATWRDQHSESKWAAMVLAEAANIDMGEPEALQLDFIEACKANPLYGSHFFYARKASDVDAVKDLPKDLICAFNSDGMSFLSMDREVLSSYGYADIYRWGGSSSQFSLIIWDANTEDTFELSLYTSQAADMAALILDYINAIMAITN
jgi:hypothetical protein